MFYNLSANTEISSILRRLLLLVVVVFLVLVLLVVMVVFLTNANCYTSVLQQAFQSHLCWLLVIYHQQFSPRMACLIFFKGRKITLFLWFSNKVFRNLRPSLWEAITSWWPWLMIRYLFESSSKMLSGISASDNYSSYYSVTSYSSVSNNSVTVDVSCHHLTWWITCVLVVLIIKLH